MEYRGLTAVEIDRLESNGCSCTDWSRVKVAEAFDAATCRNVRFSGDVELGDLSGTFTLEGGIELPAGITNATIHNCRIGNHVYIKDISNYIAGYDIADDVFVENVDRMVATGKSAYGNGVDVSVLNETGGREVPMYERLSAQIAYLIAMYRHRPAMVATLRRMIADFAEMRSKERPQVGHNARIVNAGTITDVNIGAWTTIEGAAKLTNGTTAASEVHPVYVGTNVMATNFILAAGAHVDDSAVLLNAFVGQASHITHLFSAHDSLFFSNCACENGESAAVFGGPYTVTMHKSSLLIAGMFSFLNAGSGSNQSNHMYKLGPIHQGVVERGSKTTSDSYVLWPARIGAFSLVMGRHVSHPDTSRLPFSYIIENSGRSFLVPGVNLKSVGTIRDAQKWPKRDKRKGNDRLDCINFNLLSPFTISHMMDGISLLDEIEQTGGLTSDRYTFQTMTIEARALRKGREYYRMAIDKFMGNSVIKRLEGLAMTDAAAITERLKPTSAAGIGDWIDLSGMIAPKSEIYRLCDDLESGACTSLDEVERRLHSIHAAYYDMEWSWVVENFPRWWGKECSELTPADVVAIVGRWRKSVIKLDEMLYDDARKEFSLVAHTGFGVDSKRYVESDFEQVRGDFENDSFVKMVVDHMAAKNALGQELIDRVTPLL